MDDRLHTMQLTTTHSSGAEEWYCPTCGRRFLLQWPPAYSKIVLEPGDEFAIHSGGRSGVSMGTPTIGTGEAANSADEPLETIQGADGVTMEFLGDPAPADSDDDVAIELSDEMLEPWRRYIEGQVDND